MTNSDAIRELYSEDQSMSKSEIAELLDCTYSQVHSVIEKWKIDNAPKKMPFSKLKKAIQTNNLGRVRRWIVNNCDNEDFKQAFTCLKTTHLRINEKGYLDITVNEGRTYKSGSTSIYETLFNTSLLECKRVISQLLPKNHQTIHQQKGLCYQATILI